MELAALRYEQAKAEGNLYWRMSLREIHDYLTRCPRCGRLRKVFECYAECKFDLREKG